jgi:uncharacterized protein YndB with AHSA1/START domain
MTSNSMAGTDLPTDQVRVTASVSAPVAHVWEVLISPIGASALLGQGVVLGAKGEPYHAADGAYGVVRSFHPLEQLRVSWHESPDGPPSLLEIGLVPDGQGTAVSLVHSHLQNPAVMPELDRLWRVRLQALASAARTVG